MACWTVEHNITAYLDGTISEVEAEQVQSHLSRCAACAAKVAAQLQMRAMIRLLPQKAIPPELPFRLRVIASQHRAARRWGGNLRLTIENLMKPIALPAAGGLAAAVILFMALMPTFAQTRSLTSADVPIGLFTEPQLKTLQPIGFHYGDAEVDVRIDEQGRLINYSIVSGSSSESRRSIENNLLFTIFTPATAFGKPITGTMRLSFRSSRIDVKG